ncbi:MAG: TMEM43 family protein [Vicinamibacteria bacterium]|nr:TMEM43 family protein [Vicinamibacteria bacterium]
MADQFTEVTTQGWMSRLGGAIKGVLAGVFLFLVSFPLLWWNEGRAVQTYRSLQEGRGAVVTVKADPPDPANDQRLVHVSGLATTSETLGDPLLGVSAQAIRLTRKAETFQWTEDEKSEKRKKVGGSEETVTTYSYLKKWQEGLVASDSFKDPSGHANPPSLRIESASWQASDVRLGGFQLSDQLASRISRTETVPVSQEAIDRLPGALHVQARLNDLGIYIGADPGAPEVGDIRVTFSKVPPADVSIVAQQTGSRLGPFQTQAGDQLEMLEAGIVSPDSMFASAEQSNTMLTWGLRVLGFFLMMMGLLLVMRPLRVLADVVPFVGTLAGIGLGLIAFTVATPLTLLTIALAWIAHRPLLGIGLLILCGVTFAFLAMRVQKRRASLAPALASAR